MAVVVGGRGAARHRDELLPAARDRRPVLRAAAAGEGGGGAPPQRRYASFRNPITVVRSVNN